MKSHANLIWLQLRSVIIFITPIFDCPSVLLLFSSHGLLNQLMWVLNRANHCLFHFSLELIKLFTGKEKWRTGNCEMHLIQPCRFTTSPAALVLVEEKAKKWREEFCCNHTDSHRFPKMATCFQHRQCAVALKQKMTDSEIIFANFMTIGASWNLGKGGIISRRVYQSSSDSCRWDKCLFPSSPSSNARVSLLRELPLVNWDWLA